MDNQFGLNLTHPGPTGLSIFTIQIPGSSAMYVVPFEKFREWCRVVSEAELPQIETPNKIELVS